jgi:two-component system, OmpR family, sensor histidine kinase MtrB
VVNHPERSVSLRWRVAVGFGLGSLLLSTLVAVATWHLAAGYMVNQRESSALRQAQVNVRLVNSVLGSGSGGLDELLTGMSTGSYSTVLVARPESWLASGRPVDPAALPPALLAMAREGTPSQQRLVVEGAPVLAVAFPTEVPDTFYIELFPLVALDDTLRFLSGLLVAGTLASGVLGMGLGWWMSGRALRPLAALTTAAARMAGGDLAARVPAQGDPDLARLAGSFNVTAEALQARVLRDARFAGDVSHELRSPLTTMANAVELLQRRRSEMSDTAQRALDLLAAEVHRFERTVVDLLEISRADQDADRDGWEEVDLPDLVRNVIAVRPGPPPAVEVAAPADDTGRELHVPGDRRRLDRVVSNLLDNAQQHGGGAVRVGVHRSDDRVRLEVDDRGPGVPAALRERVFDRFARGEQAGRRADGTGSGLGLALVHQHVTRHGGQVRIEDRPGGGARFVVELPAVPAHGPSGRRGSHRAEVGAPNR